MKSFLELVYLYNKSLHIISFVSWMAGLFYLPRLFVYHSMQPKNSPMSDTFKVMERRLLWIIMMPAMVFTLVSGLMLSLTPSVFAWDAAWFYWKMTCVSLMVVYHCWLMIQQRRFAQNKNTYGHKFFRMMNEVPTILLIVIVVLAIVRP